MIRSGGRIERCPEYDRYCSPYQAISSPPFGPFVTALDQVRRVPVDDWIRACLTECDLHVTLKKEDKGEDGVQMYERQHFELEVRMLGFVSRRVNVDVVEREASI